MFLEGSYVTAAQIAVNLARKAVENNVSFKPAAERRLSDRDRERRVELS